MSSGAHIRNGSCSSELPHDYRCDLWLVSFMTHEGHLIELPLCRIFQNQVRVTQGFHVFDFFCAKLQLLQLNSTCCSFLSCPAIPSAERLLQPWAEYRPRQMRMKRMSIMMKYMTLRPGDKFFRVKKRCEQKWSIYFVEFNVTPDLLFDSLCLRNLPFSWIQCL